MSRKRSVSTSNECNNNVSVPPTKQQRVEMRLKAQLRSDLTEKMITPVKTTDGQRTTRSGRLSIQKIETPPKMHINKPTMTENSQSLNKRKVRKFRSIQNLNRQLRFVKFNESTITPIFAQSPIYKSISNTKIGLNNDQFQTQLIDKCTKTDTHASHATVVTDSYADCNSISNSIGKIEMATMNTTADVPIEHGAIDFEDDIKSYRLVRKSRTESIQIIDEIDLTLSDHSDIEADDKSSIDCTEHLCAEVHPISEADSTSPTDDGAPEKKTDMDKSLLAAVIANEPNVYTIKPISDCEISTSNPDANSFNDQAFSESTNDDCIMMDCTNVDSTDSWQVGQIVWAALPTFWPAIICKENNEFQRGNMMHVKFLYDNGRRSWVNMKHAVLPFNGREDLKEKCKLPQNKRIKAYKLKHRRSWEIAILEANVLQCIKLSNRIGFYDSILMNSVHELESEFQERFKSENRCDTPQTFDTAYSSMKQSVSPASLSPTLNELDRNYDVHKNINNYFESVETSSPDELPVEDLHDDTASYGRMIESPSSTAQIFCPLFKLITDKLREHDTRTAHISNESGFASNLSELWTGMKNIPLKEPQTSLAKRKTRSLSVDSATSMLSNSTVSTPTQSARQKLLAEKKAEKLQPKEISEEMYTIIERPSKEQLRLDRKRRADEKIMSFCMLNHPANFILKPLPKDPVCEVCLESGTVLKCAGKCSGYFHKECIDKSVDVSQYNAILKLKLKKARKPDDDSAEPICDIETNSMKLQCQNCSTSQTNVCFVCSKSDGVCIQCDKNCGKAYHIECLKYWPQHKKEYVNNKVKAFTCSRHVCHTCVSPDIRNLFHNAEPDKKLIKCLLCPGTYHRSSECIPAGSELLSETQLICARHQSPKNKKRINIDYCLFCSEGGTLVCCDACVYSFHQDCLKVTVGDLFNCEECESGRRPLYGEIVWCKYGSSPWWPAIIIPPPCIPDRVMARRLEPHTICVFFFGTHDFGWVNQTSIYLYLKGDGEWKTKNEKEALINAIDEAEQWKNRFQEIYEKNGKTKMALSKPPPYKKVKTNKVIAKITDDSEYNECACRPDDPAPCSLESNCYNVMSYFECDPELCPAKDKCQNQNFRRGKQFKFQIKMTDSKGWGLYAQEEIPVEKFVVEYMGEVIDNVEFDQRFSRAFANKDDNYYFLTLGNGLYIDAAIYGNEARFINHSCEPNVVPNKWTIYSNGQEQIRIGFFALRNILPGEEITFDYNWGKTKNMETVCRCGSKKCRGYI